MAFLLKPIEGTSNHLIVLKPDEGGPRLLVAEIVKTDTGYVLYRMDATGQLGSDLESPETALAVYEEWVDETKPDIAGVSF